MNERCPCRIDLPLPGLSAKLPDRLDEQKDAVHPRMTVGQPPSIGIERKVAAWRGSLIGHELAALAAPAETESFEGEKHGNGEAVVTLDHIDSVVPDSRHLEGGPA